MLEEVCGPKVFHMDFEPSGTAASVMSETFGAAVLLNAGNARWRRNHDLANELFHLLTWFMFHPAAGGSMVAEEWEEKLATAFASSLLMPTESFDSAVKSRARDGRVTYESVFDIAREFDVSAESVLWRMHFVYNRGQSKSDLTKSEIEPAKRLSPLLEERRESDAAPLAVSLSGTGNQGPASRRDRDWPVRGVPEHQQARSHAFRRAGGARR